MQREEFIERSASLEQWFPSMSSAIDKEMDDKEKMIVWDNITTYSIGVTDLR